MRLYFRLGFTIFCAVFFILFCLLGMWQLQRYHFKKELLQLYHDRLEAAPRSLSEVLAGHDLSFQRIKVSGKFLFDQTMLMQDQFFQDQLGYEVLTPFQIDHDKKLLLIDRGWSNGYLPEKNNNSTVTISGYIKLLNEYQFILGDNILKPDSRPLTMQKINIEEISRITHQDYYRFILRLDPAMPNGFTRQWTISTVLPERHLGYAIQWFVMAFVLVIAYFCFCYDRGSK